jgi:hypothetical protein
MRLDHKRKLYEGEKTITLGGTAHNQAVEATAHRINDFQSELQYYSDRLQSLGESVDGRGRGLKDSRYPREVFAYRDTIKEQDKGHCDTETRRQSDDAPRRSRAANCWRRTSFRNMLGPLQLYERFGIDKIDWSTPYRNKLLLRVFGLVFRMEVRMSQNPYFQQTTVLHMCRWSILRRVS